jgi:two-component system CheB/CheR fusion protein
LVVPDPVPASPVTDADGLYVVGVGASAGGLDALEKLFACMPPDTGAAFVVVQHLSPDHKSMMASLLQRHTRMPVLMIEDDMPLGPNQVFLIPPGALMHVDDGRLRLTPKSPRSLTLPIDVFFQSLATHYGERAVAVVLSGTGSDGTRGAGSINEAGGFLIAQEPESAKFDGMPRSVIATGLVDAVLPVEEIAPRIVAHMSNQPLPLLPSGADASASVAERGTEAALAGVLNLLLQLGGINFEDYKPGTVLRRIERRMAVRQLATIEDYLQQLQQDRAEVLTLRRELLIPVTSFFRDTEAFDFLARRVIESIVQSKQAGDPIRIWCAGVATGEEAYSVAMLFLEAFEQVKRWPSLKVFATDVEQVNIETAAAGAYPESIVAEIGAQQIERFFVKKGSHFVVKNELRQCIVFARHNLLADPPFTKMDLVLCRNTLIYFRNPAQERVLRRLQYALVPNGYLFLGSSETLGELQRDYLTLSAKHKLWQVLRPATAPLDLNKNLGAHRATPPPAKSPWQALAQQRVGQSAVELGFGALLKAFAPPPAILVNARLELVHSYGEVHPFLRIRPGQASLDVSRLLNDALVPVAAALLFKSGRDRVSAVSDPVTLTPAPTAGVAPQALPVRLSAMPAGEADGQQLTLLVFESVSASERSDAVRVDVPSETAERLEVLEHELCATRQSLQATIEQLETSNEELQATNEEMMAANEELQSSNEELQSVNEELNTVNAEYQEKIEVLNRINADLDNLARVVSAGTIFVDERLHLTRFSPEAAPIFRLRSSDIGRPLEDLNHTLDYPDFMGHLHHALRTRQLHEQTVRGLQDRTYLVRMLPYAIASSAALGVVISFLDVTAVHQASRLQAILDALAEHVAVLDAEGRIVAVNASWSQAAAARPQSGLVLGGLGLDYVSACRQSSGCAAAAAAAEGVQALLQGRSTEFNLEYGYRVQAHEFWFVMHVRALRELAGGPGPAGVVVSHVDISAWHRARRRSQTHGELSRAGPAAI